MGAQFLLLPTKMFLILSCFAATSFASPLQFERVPSLDNRIPLLVQDRVPNPCLTKANDTCIFPFKYNGVEYYRCTYADSPTPWCATMVDPNNTVVTNNWGDCSTSQFSNYPEDTPDLPSCTAESGASCVFPFRHLGITYTSCASTDLLPLPGAPLAHMRMEPIFLELSLSALQLVLVSPLQPLLHCLRQQQLQQPVQLPQRPLQSQQQLLSVRPQHPPQPQQRTLSVPAQQRQAQQRENLVFFLSPLRALSTLPVPSGSLEGKPRESFGAQQRWTPKGIMWTGRGSMDSAPPNAPQSISLT